MVAVSLKKSQVFLEDDFLLGESAFAAVFDALAEDSAIGIFPEGVSHSEPALARALLAEFDLAAAPGLAGIIGVIKVCPTPDGRGIHMVLNTQRGPLTVIYMPQTPVTDGARLAFDDVEAMLIDLPAGSAAVIGHEVEEYYALVHDSLQPLAKGP